MDNFVSWITQDNLTAVVCSRGCDCKLIGQVYADGSETVTGSNSLTRNILSNNLCQGSWSPGPNFSGNSIPPDRISRGIQSPGKFNPPDRIYWGIQSPRIEFPGKFNPPDRISWGIQSPPDRISRGIQSPRIEFSPGPNSRWQSSLRSNTIATGLGFLNRVDPRTRYLTIM